MEGDKNISQEEDKEYSKWMCDCHNSMEEHFIDIAKKDGIPVARTCYSLLVNSIVNTEREIMMEQFEAFINLEGKDGRR